jgi:hypothetical protein
MLYAFRLVQKEAREKARERLQKFLKLIEIESYHDGLPSFGL